MITAGTYKARVQGEVVLGSSKSKGTPFVEFYLTILEGDNKGGRARWTGYFTENTNKRTVQALQICGWQGEEISEFNDGELHGLDANEVEIVVELETYQNEAGEDRTAPRVAWINRAGGFLNKAAAMNDEAAKAFSAKMRGFIIQSKAQNPQPASAAKPPATKAPAPGAAPSPPADDEIPF